MIKIRRLEKLGIFGLSLFLFMQILFSWWWFPLLFPAPDIGMTGYLTG